MNQKTENLNFCSPETKIINAKKVMKEFNCDTLSIIDKDQKIHGIITHQDICRFIENNNESNYETIRIKDIIN